MIYRLLRVGSWVLNRCRSVHQLAGFTHLVIEFLEPLEAADNLIVLLLLSLQKFLRKPFQRVGPRTMGLILLQSFVEL